MNRLNNSSIGNPRGSMSPGYVPSSPYGVNFENEGFNKKNQKRQYRDDLDYLMSLRTQLGGEEFDRRYGSEMLSRFQKMDDKHVYNQYENKNFRKGLMRQYENEMSSHKDQEKFKKQNELENDKKYLDSLEYQNYLENQKKLEYKLKLKNDHQGDLEKFYQKKKEEELKRYEEGFRNQKLIEEQNKMQNDRDNYYRNKLNNMNNKIYDRALQYGGYLQTNQTNSPRMNEPFHVKNDFEFNKRIAEMKAMEKESIKRDPSGLNERMREAERLREIENKERMERLGNQKSYKEYLDQQKNWKNMSKINQDNSEPGQLLLPSYHYPNIPTAVANKAVDGIAWVKGNHTETLNNGNKNYYLGDTKLKHNPILQPLDNIEYNKYLNKQRQILSHSPINPGNSNDSTLVNAGNKLFL